MKYLKQTAFLLFIVAVISINVNVIYGSSMSTSCTDNCSGIKLICNYDENGQLSSVECQYVDGHNDVCHNCASSELEEN